MKTNPVIVNYVFQWLDSQSTQELDQKAANGYNLVKDLNEVRMQVKMAKVFTSLNVDADDLLDQILEKRPEHGKVLFRHRTWYNQQIESLRSTIEAL